MYLPQIMAENMQAHDVSLDDRAHDARRPIGSTPGPQGEHFLEASHRVRRPWRQVDRRRGENLMSTTTTSATVWIGPNSAEGQSDFVIAK
jgi:hypothetical protein